MPWQAIYREMMSHPALFTHPKPLKVAVIDENQAGIAEEILKHTTITNVLQPDATSAPFDIIILATEKPPAPLSTYYDLLNNDGILLCQSTSPFELQSLKAQYQQLKSQPFYDIQLVSFPQPNNAVSWRSALMAIKNTAFKRVREKDIFNRTFTTKYYNFDVHKASLVLAEFMREELST